MPARAGSADLPLHGGRAPAWLFGRMRELAGEVGAYVVVEFGAVELLRRLADPGWFQALGCVLGFDWHSSGLTTTVTAALKEGLARRADELGVVVAGGKGRTSRRTPDELREAADRWSLDGDALAATSRLVAKVDSAAVQDGHQLYHHAFVLSSDGTWTVVQQGMDGDRGTARRYHWHSAEVPDPTADPHTGVAAQTERDVLNLVAGEAGDNRRAVAALARERPERVAAEWDRVRRLVLPRRHQVTEADIHPDRLERILAVSYDGQPEDFSAVLGVPGLGAKSLRALALTAEVVFGAPASYRDPASYAWAHGGKDGTPFPVDRWVYDRSIEVIREAVRSAKVGGRERSEALRRLARLAPE